MNTFASTNRSIHFRFEAIGIGLAYVFLSDLFWAVRVPVAGV